MKRGDITIKNALALVLAVLLLCGAVFFIAFESGELNHECTGEDCPICAVIQLCENGTRLLSQAVLAVFSFIAVLCLAKESFISFFNQIIIKTPTGQRVRLNN